MARGSGRICNACVLICLFNAGTRDLVRGICTPQNKPEPGWSCWTNHRGWCHGDFATQFEEEEFGGGLAGALPGGSTTQISPMTIGRAGGCPSHVLMVRIASSQAR